MTETTAPQIERMRERAQETAERTAERAREMGERAAGRMEEFMHRPALQRVWEGMERVPDGVYYGAMFGSILGSLAFFIAGKRQTALFIGQWAPTLACLGLMNKLIRPSEG